MPRRPKIKRARGSVLVFALIVLTVLLVSAIAVSIVAVGEKRSAFATQRSVLAFQAADSGAERVIKRIYINNSPTVGTAPLNANMGLFGGDASLNDLKNNLSNVVATPTCNNGKITAQNSVTPAYSFEITFYEQSSTTPIGCSDTAWRDKAVKIKSEGFFRGTSRVIEIGIRPRT